MPQKGFVHLIYALVKLVLSLILRLLVKMVYARGANGSGQAIIILLFFLTQSKFDPITFESKNLDPYPTRLGYGSSRPDPYKIIKYLLNIFYIILNN
jgi:hypothetical protein